MEEEEVEVTSLSAVEDFNFFAFRGEIGAGLSRAIIQIKIQQKIKTTTTHPELVGKFIKPLYKHEYSKE